MIVNDKELSENDEEFDESIEDVIVEQKDQFQTNAENLHFEEVDKDYEASHKKISELELYNESLEDGFETTEQFPKDDKCKKELLVNFFSQLNKGMTS